MPKKKKKKKWNSKKKALQSWRVQLVFIDKSLTLQKTLEEFMFESRRITIDQLYDKFSITKPIEVIMITNNK